MRLSCCLSGLLLLPILLSAEVDHRSNPNDFSLEEVAPGIYLHRGLHADLDDPRRGDSANIGFIEGSDCVAVIDSGGSQSTGSHLLDAISQRTDKPVCYLINTHVHFDRVLGNGAFDTEGIQFFGHGNLAEALAANKTFFAEHFAEELGGPETLGNINATRVWVDWKMEIDLGGRPLVLQAHALAHTSTDLTVLDRKTNSLWAGDLLFRERMPILDGSLKGWLGWMEGAMKRPYSLVIPGHGEPDLAWPKGAAAQYRYLQTLLDETRAAVAAGLFIEDAKGVVGVDEKALWSLSDSAHGRNVSRAFRELEWE